MNTEDKTILIETLMDKPCSECGKQHTLGTYLNDKTNTYWIECFDCSHEYNTKIN